MKEQVFTIEQMKTLKEVGVDIEIAKGMAYYAIYETEPNWFNELREREVEFDNNYPHIPHFHICDKTTLGSNFHTCVKIENAEYFHHTGKEDVLNTKQRKALIQFLNSTCDLGITYWKFLIMTWNSNNSSKKISINCKMPDYSKL